jgi:nucleotide-binding universal stress UspA family protein
VGSPSGVERSSRRPLTTVLVATDLSEGSQLAVARALRLPCGVWAKRVFLHVVADDIESANARGEEVVLAHHLDEARRLAARGAGSAVADRDIISSMARGKASREIVRAASTEKAELIVLGRHGKSSVRATRLGSTAEKAIRGATTSVLVVSQPVSGPYRRPLVAVDFSETSGLAVDLALRLTDVDTSTIDVLHVLGARKDDLPQDFVAKDHELEARTRLAAFLAPFAGPGLEFTPVIERGDPRDVIVDAAAARGCDLIVVGARGRASLERFLVGSVAEGVVRAARCDVLVVRPTADSIR